MVCPGARSRPAHSSANGARGDLGGGHDEPVSPVLAGRPRSSLQIPAVRPGPPLVGEAALQLAFAIHQVFLVREFLDALGAVDVDEPELVRARPELPRFIANIVVAALEPPEHMP